MFRRAFLMIIAAVGVMMAACSSLAPVPPTLTPTRAFSAPTLQPTPFVWIDPPTLVPSGMEYIGRNNPDTGGLPANAEIPPLVVSGAGENVQSVRVTIREGFTLVGDLYENPPLQTEQNLMIQRLPGILLLSTSAQAWGAFPSALRDAGFTVLVVEVYAGMTAAEVTIVLQALSEAQTVNPGLIAVIGAGEGADLGFLGCALDLICDGAALLSPVRAETLVNVMANYAPRPLLLVTDDAEGTTAQTIQASAGAALTLQTASGSGAAMLTAQPALTDSIVAWLRANLVE